MVLKSHWPALVLAAVPAAILLRGGATGKMLMRYGWFDKQSNAPGYWLMAFVWAALLIILLLVGLGV